MRNVTLMMQIMQRTPKMRSPNLSDDSDAGPPVTIYISHNITISSFISTTHSYHGLSADVVFM